MLKPKHATLHALAGVQSETIAKGTRITQRHILSPIVGVISYTFHA